MSIDEGGRIYLMVLLSSSTLLCPFTLSVAFFFISPFCLLRSLTCFLHLIFGYPRFFLSTTNSNALFHSSTLQLFETCPYHQTQSPLASLPKNFCHNQQIHMFSAFPILNQMNSIHALTIALSVFKIVISFSH